MIAGIPTGIVTGWQAGRQAYRGHTHTQMDACMHTHIQTCNHTHINPYNQACTPYRQAHTDSHTYICIHAHIHKHIHAYNHPTCIMEYIYTCIHTYRDA